MTDVIDVSQTCGNSAAVLVGANVKTIIRYYSCALRLCMRPGSAIPLATLPRIRATSTAPMPVITAPRSSGSRPIVRFISVSIATRRRPRSTRTSCHFFAEWRRPSDRIRTCQAIESASTEAARPVTPCWGRRLGFARLAGAIDGLARLQGVPAIQEVVTCTRPCHEGRRSGLRYRPDQRRFRRLPAWNRCRAERHGPKCAGNSARRRQTTCGSRDKFRHLAGHSVWHPAACGQNHRRVVVDRSGWRFRRRWLRQLTLHLPYGAGAIARVAGRPDQQDKRRQGSRPGRSTRKDLRKRPSTCVTNTVLPSGPPKVRFDGTFPRKGISGRAGLPSGVSTATVPALGRTTKILPSMSVRRPSRA